MNFPCWVLGGRVGLGGGGCFRGSGGGVLLGGGGEFEFAAEEVDLAEGTPCVESLVPSGGVGCELGGVDFPTDVEVVNRANFFAVANDPNVHGLKVAQGFSGVAACCEKGGDECGE